MKVEIIAKKKKKRITVYKAIKSRHKSRPEKNEKKQIGHDIHRHIYLCLSYLYVNRYKFIINMIEETQVRLVTAANRINYKE